MWCAYTQFQFSLSALRVFRVSFVQGQRGSFEIGENGGPTLFTQSFHRSALGGLPSRREFLHLFSTFRRNCQFDKPAAPTAADPHQTVSLQWTKIPHERRALHPEPITQFRHSPTALGAQCRQNRPLCGTDSMPPHFRIKELRHFPRYPTQVEAYAVFHRRQIKFFGHDVYMHYWGKIVKAIFGKNFPALVSRAKTPENHAFA